MKITLKKTQWFTAITMLCIVVTALILAVSCDKQEPLINYPIKIPSTEIGQGVLWGIIDNLSGKDIIITTEMEWDDLKAKLDWRNNVTNGFSETNIDFVEYQIIAVFDIIHGNGGWSIDITDITEYPEEIVVTIEQLMKGDATSVVTQPYHIVKIPRSTKSIRFQEVDIPVRDYPLALAGTLCQWANLNYNDELIVINSNEELGNYITCTNGDPRPIGGVGGGRFMLLANGSTNNGISTISKKLQRLYPEKYILNVEITLNDATVVQPWAFVITVEKKLNKDSTFELNVTTIRN